MKKSELRQIIREEIQKLNETASIGSTVTFTKGSNKGKTAKVHGFMPNIGVYYLRLTSGKDVTSTGSDFSTVREGEVHEGKDKWVVIFGKKGEKPGSAEYTDEKGAKDFKKSVEKDGIKAMIVKR